MGDAPGELQARSRLSDSVLGFLLPTAQLHKPSCWHVQLVACSATQCCDSSTADGNHRSWVATAHPPGIWHNAPVGRLLQGAECLPGLLSAARGRGACLAGGTHVCKGHHLTHKLLQQVRPAMSRGIAQWGAESLCFTSRGSLVPHVRVPVRCSAHLSEDDQRQPVLGTADQLSAQAVQLAQSHRLQQQRVVEEL